MKKAFVTGATGFLGLNLINRLHHKNWEITALHLPGENLKYLSRFEVTPVAGNILEVSSLQKAMPENVDAVFHLAGDISMWHKNDDRQYKINVHGTANMCRAALEKNANRFIHTSSSSAFGYHGTELTEQTVSNAMVCRMSYNQTKYLAEQEVKESIAAGLFAVILNPCNIIGPYDPGNWSQLIKNVCQGKLPGYPPGLGTFAHAWDVADAHIAAVEKGQNGENYLLGGVRASFKEVISQIVDITQMDLSLKKISKQKLQMMLYLGRVKSFFDGREPLLTYPKFMRLTGTLICDDTKARKELGFKTTTIRKMLTDCYGWMKQEQII
jgi:nucleoside-diphosphate-sugar epimerase